MKLLIISPYFYEPHRWMISGYKTALELSKQILVVVLTTGQHDYEKLHENLAIYRIKDIFLPDPINFSFIPNLFGHLKRVIAKEQPDCYLVNKNMFYSSLAIIYLRFKGKKVITQVDTFPGINWFSRNRYVNIVLWIYARTIGLLLLKLSYKVVLLHEGLIPVAKKYKLKYTIIHNGVDIEAIKTTIPADLPTRTTSEVRIAYVGRLESVKGYYDLLLAAKNLIKDNPKLTFYFIGNSQGKDDIIKEFSSPQIVFLGHRTDVLSLLKKMDIYVLPSYSEGLPNALMEAMASGIACIGSNVGGIKILIKNNQTGLLFEPGNTKQIENRIKELAANPDLRKRLGQTGKELIESSFNWKNIAQQLTALLRGTL